jgi:hypothetical protein
MGSGITYGSYGISIGQLIRLKKFGLSLSWSWTLKNILRATISESESTIGESILNSISYFWALRIICFFISLIKLFCDG